MPILHDFEYIKPQSLDEAIDLLSNRKNAAILAGGTDLVVNMKQELQTPGVVIDIKGLQELKQIEFKNDSLFIGALVTFSDILESNIIIDKFPLLREASATVASIGIRNRATMVGNICSAVPSMDSGPPLLVYDAEVILKGNSGERRVPIGEWFKGPRATAIKPDEIVTAITIPLPFKKHAGCYVRLGRYAGEDLAQVAVAVLAMANKEYRIAFGAVAPTPVRAKKIENMINGKPIDDSLLIKALNLIPQEIAPISDIRASKEYRLHIARVIMERGLKTAVARLYGEGPEYGTRLV